MNVVATAVLLVFTLLVILFRGSSAFSKEISAGKYPGYHSYQQTVPRFIPWKLFFR